MSYREARSLEVLHAEVNKAYPERSTESDGWIGDPDHASRTSDHNPWVEVNGVGIVRARDFTDDPEHGCDARRLAENIRLAGIKGHPALGQGAYVISEGEIASATNDGAPWDWEPYGGWNLHDKHCHVSVALDPEGFDSTREWRVAGPREYLRPIIDFSNVRWQATARHKTNIRSVRRVQRRLRRKLRMYLEIDGIFGPTTKKAYRLWEVRCGASPRNTNGIPNNIKHMRRLAGPFYRVRR